MNGRRVDSVVVHGVAVALLAVGLSVSAPLAAPAGATGVTVPLAAGIVHTCALTSAGGIKCWGYNGSGELGDGTTTSSSTPVDVSGLTSGVAAVSASEEHTCALTSAGGVKCWGDNTSGQLGDGTTTMRLTPVTVSGLPSGVTAVATASDHTCALTATGGVECWGSNVYGELGDGTTTNKLTPVDVSGLTSGATAIAVGFDDSCAVTSVGGVKCWGDNAEGQLGDGTTTNRLTPVDVSGLTSGMIGVAAGAGSTCAVTVGGGVKCWGYNSNGQLGDGTTTNRLTPVDVSGLTSGVTTIAIAAVPIIDTEPAGLGHTCALTSAGGVKCWGYNYNGQLGDGTTTDSSTPVDVSGLTSGVTVIAAGDYHACALTSAGGVKCWGDNSEGQLGDGTTTVRSTPVDVSGLTGVTAIAAGFERTCAVTAVGGVQCWGDNTAGQLGDGMATDSSTPVDVSGLTSGMTAVATGDTHSCALTSAGGIKCWGDNFYGDLGNGTTVNSSTPVDVSGLTSGATAIAVGFVHSCAVTAGGGVQCWGYNYNGQLGDGAATNSSTPVDVSGLTSGATAIATGFNHSCAVTAGGGVQCWGSNNLGQLGDGTTTSSSTPVDVYGLTSGVTSIAAGEDHTCALTSAGGVKCWGSNYIGQLGDGTTANRLTPVDVSGLTSGATAVAANYTHTCALTVAGGVNCWGDNTSGQLGDGTTTSSPTPVDVSGLTSGVTAVAAGYTHTCALTVSGGIKCWGDNSRGALGVNPGWLPVDAIGSFYVPSIPRAPTIGTATAGNTSAIVSWTAPIDIGPAITSYAVTASPGGRTATVDGSHSSAMVTGLTNGRSYTFTVTATNGVGTSAPSAPSNSIVPATVPTSPLSPSALPGNGQATVKWTVPANNGGSAITGYVVTPYLAAVAQTAHTFASTATTEIVTGLTNTKSYTFKVAAKNAVGTGPQSVATAPILVGLPIAPSGVIANGGFALGKAQVQWTSPTSNGGSSITGYVVTPYIGGTAQPQRVFTSPQTFEVITGLTTGTKYTFKVAAINANGTGLPSLPDTPITVGPPAVASAPLLPSAVPGNGQVTLTWTAPTSNGSANITGYIVTPYLAGVAQPIRVFNANTTQTVTGLTNTKSYTFKIAAGNAAGTSPQSVASSPVTVGAPTAPTALTATGGVGQAVLHWTAPTSNNGSTITAYVVTPYLAGVAQTAVTFASVATTETVTGLTAGKSYTFKVAAKNGNGVGPQSAASNAVTPT